MEHRDEVWMMDWTLHDPWYTQVGEDGENVGHTRANHVVFPDMLCVCGRIRFEAITI